MKQGTILGSQKGRWIILAALAAVLAVLLTASAVRAQDDATIKFPEMSKDAVATFTATDPEDDTPITWALPTDASAVSGIEGEDDQDAVHFDISKDGVLTFDIGGDSAENTTTNSDDPEAPASSDTDLRVAPDYENAQDDGGDNIYRVVVRGSDPRSNPPDHTYHKVVVEVTNVDEDGVVTWGINHNPTAGDTTPCLGDNDIDTPTLLQFQAGDVLCATVKDGDMAGAAKTVSSVIWRWYRSPTNSSTGGTPIEGANSSTYTVQDKTGSDDVGMYLRAEASYTDGSELVTASKVSDYPVQAFRANNEKPTFGSDTSTPRSVNEGKKGMVVGAPVTATDADGDIRNYTLSGGADVTKFEIDQKSGQITTLVLLNFEAAAGAANNCTDKNACVVTVRATDSAGESTDSATDITVNITIKDVNEKPTFDNPLDANTTNDHVGDSADNSDRNVTGQTIFENAKTNPTGGDATLEVAIYTANDQDGDNVSLTLTGDDAKMFRLDDTAITFSPAVTVKKVLSFKASPNYEDPKDKDKDNVYKVTVRASDTATPALYSDKHITVRVTNLNEGPELDPPTSYEFDENGKEAVATLTATDPEGATSFGWLIPDASAVNADGLTPADAPDNTHFDIDPKTGALTFDIGGDTDNPDVSVAPDYEMPRGQAKSDDNTNTYKAVVQICDLALTTADNPSCTGQSRYQKVVVEVTDVAEEGKVTWQVDPNGDETAIPNANILGSVNKPILQFQDGAKLTASATDGGVALVNTNVIWKWYKSSSSSLCGTTELPDSDGVGNTYTVQDGDRGSYICAKATYNKGGKQQSAEKISEYKVGRNLGADNVEPDFGDDTSIPRSVNEGKKGMIVGDLVDGKIIANPVTATDTDDIHSSTNFGDVRNYTLAGTGADNSKFKIDQKTGQITTLVDLDFEADAGADDNCTARNACVVTVRATDSAGEATGTTPADMKVNITIKDVNEKPTFTAPTITTDATNLRTAIDTPEGNTVLTTNNNVSDVNVTYTATDEDAGDTAILVLEGPDKDMFEFSTAGVLSFINKPDYENPMDVGKNNRYNVTVRATDGTLFADRMIAVNVTDVNEAPAPMRSGVSVSGNSSARVAENSTDTIGTYTASGSKAASASWAKSGNDASAFTIEGSGASVMLKFSSGRDFENPSDADTNNVYEVTLTATDSAGDKDSLEVRVTVTDADEAGSVTGLPASAMVGAELTAVLSDPDGGQANVNWQWTRSATMGGTYDNIDGATTASYTILEGDANMYLKAAVTYADKFGSRKTATSEAVKVNPASAAGRYDADGDGTIDPVELFTAIDDYFAGTLGPIELFEVIDAYFGG